MRVLGLLLASLLLVGCGGEPTAPEDRAPSESPTSEVPSPLVPKPTGDTPGVQPHEDTGVPMPTVPCDRETLGSTSPPSEVDPSRCGAARYWESPGDDVS